MTCWGQSQQHQRLTSIDAALPQTRNAALYLLPSIRCRLYLTCTRPTATAAATDTATAAATATATAIATAQLANRLFGVEVVPADGEAPVWHKDVRFFKVRALGLSIGGFLGGG